MKRAKLPRKSFPPAAGPDVVQVKMNGVNKATINNYHRTKGQKGTILNRALGGRFA